MIIGGGDTVIPVGRNIYNNPELYLSKHRSNSSYYFSGNEELIYKYLFADGVSYEGEWGEGRPGVWDDGIESISAWSVLTERVKGEVVEYDESRMRYPFYSYVDAELNFNNASLFWAEGEKGPGIGGTIEVEFNREADHVMVLNGAVDIARLNLYKDNNRLKRVRVDGGAFSIEYAFEDFVWFHKIAFPTAVDRITITVLEVYPGRKWDDTCVSAIFLKQAPLRPRSEYEAVIETYIRLKGIDRLILEYERRKGGKKRQASIGEAPIGKAPIGEALATP